MGNREFCTVDHNDCVVINDDADNQLLRSTFYDDIFVIIGYNQDTGDSLMIDYIGNRGSYRVDEKIPITLRLFTEAPGQKSLFFISCNNGGFGRRAEEIRQNLAVELVGHDIRILSIDKEQLRIDYNLNNSYTIYYDPATKQCLLQQGEQKVQFEPFADIPSATDFSGSIKDKAAFFYSFYILGTPPISRGYSIASSTDKLTLDRSVSYLKAKVQSSHETILALATYQDDLVAFMNPVNDSPLVNELVTITGLSNDTDKFMRTFVSICQNVSDMQEALIELKQHELAPNYTTDIIILTGQIKEAFTNLAAAANKASAPAKVLTAINARLDQLSNSMPMELR